MDIIEQIMGIIVIVSVFIIGGMLVLTSYTDYSMKKIDVQQKSLELEKFSDDLDSLFVVTENKSQRTMGELLGILVSEQFINPQKETLQFGTEEIELDSEFKKLLDAIYGINNYYFEVRPKIEDMQAFFVVDGTPSMIPYRVQLAQTIPVIQDMIEEMDKDIKLKVYIISEDDGPKAMFDSQGIDAEILDYDTLYSYSDPPYFESATTLFYDTFNDNLMQSWQIIGSPTLSSGKVKLEKDDVIDGKKIFTLSEIDKIEIPFNLNSPHEGAGDYTSYYVMIKDVNNPDKYIKIHTFVEDQKVRFMFYDSLSFDYGFREETQQSNPASEQYATTQLSSGTFIINNIMDTIKIQFYNAQKKETYLIYSTDEFDMEKEISIEMGVVDTTGFMPEPGYAQVHEVKIVPKSTLPVTYVPKQAFFEPDWGTAVEYIVRENRESGAALNIVLPVSEELSTSSISDAFFETDYGTYPALLQDAVQDYFEYCEDACPLERSNKTLQRAIEAAQQYHFLIYPIFADPGIPDDCTKPYMVGTHMKLRTYFNNEYGFDVPEGETYCSKMFEGNVMCPGCIDNPNKVGEMICYHHNCALYVVDQMQEAAERTGGRFLTLSNVTHLLTLMNKTFTDITTLVGFSIGEEKMAERYSFERDVPLLDASEGYVTARLLVYDQKTDKEFGKIDYRNPEVVVRFKPQAAFQNEQINISVSGFTERPIISYIMQIRDSLDTVIYEEAYHRDNKTYYVDTDMIINSSVNETAIFDIINTTLYHNYSINTTNLTAGTYTLDILLIDELLYDDHYVNQFYIVEPFPAYKFRCHSWGIGAHKYYDESIFDADLEEGFGSDIDYSSATTTFAGAVGKAMDGSVTVYETIDYSYGTFENPGNSCHDILKKNPHAQDGVYWVDFYGAREKTEVYCDMTTDGGGWTFFAYVGPDTTPRNFLDEDFGDYDVNRGENVLYSLGVLDEVPDNELMVLVDNKDLIQAENAKRMVFFRYDDGTFDHGFYPFSIGGEFEYRIGTYDYWHEGKRNHNIGSTGDLYDDNGYHLFRFYPRDDYTYGIAIGRGITGNEEYRDRKVWFYYRENVQGQLDFSDSFTFTGWVYVSGEAYGSEGKPGASCSDILRHNPDAEDGIYVIEVKGEVYEVYCDMTTDGGGWTFFGHNKNNADGRGFFIEKQGTYRTDRVNEGTVYTLGILDEISDYEMMGTIDVADPGQADAENKICFYTYDVDHPGFNNGPVPCVGLEQPHQYKVSIDGEYMDIPSTYRCNNDEWYPGFTLAKPENHLLFFKDHGGSGNYWGAGMGGDNNWGHDGYWYVRDHEHGKTIAKGDSYGITIGTGRMSGFVGDEQVFIDISEGWHYITFSYNKHAEEDNMKIYVDGQLSGVKNVSVTIEPTDEEFVIKDGIYDELMLFDRALSPAEVGNLYTYGRNNGNIPSTFQPSSYMISDYGNLSFDMRWYKGDTLQQETGNVNDDGLVAWYPFDSDMRDYKGENDLSRPNTGEYLDVVNALVGQGALYVPKMETLSLPDTYTMNLPQDFSIEAWVKAIDDEKWHVTGETYERELTLNQPTAYNNLVMKIVIPAGTFANMEELSKEHVAFRDMNGNLLERRFVTFNTLGESIVLVRIPQAGTERIMMEYGKFVYQEEADITFIEEDFETYQDNNDMRDYGWDNHGSYSNRHLVESGLDGKSYMIMQSNNLEGGFGYLYKSFELPTTQTRLFVLLNDIECTQGGSSYTGLRLYFKNRESILKTIHWKKSGSDGSGEIVQFTGERDEVILGSINLNNYAPSETDTIKIEVVHYKCDPSFPTIVDNIFSYDPRYTATISNENRKIGEQYTATKRRAVTIQNPGESIASHQVKVRVYKDQEMQDDYDDIRFSDTEGNMLPHYIQQVTQDYATVWVRVPKIEKGRNLIYLYYGNELAEKGDSIELTFPEYEFSYSRYLGYGQQLSETLDLPEDQTWKIFEDQVTFSAKASIKYRYDGNYFRVILNGETLVNEVDFVIWSSSPRWYYFVDNQDITDLLIEGAGEIEIIGHNIYYGNVYISINGYKMKNIEQDLHISVGDAEDIDDSEIGKLITIDESYIAVNASQLESNMKGSRLESIQYGGWNHVVVTHGNGAHNLYINNFPAGSTSSNSVIGEVSEMTVGDHLNGYIDEFRIYNRTLSQQEVAMHYSAQTGFNLNQEIQAGDTWKLEIIPVDSGHVGIGCNKTFSIQDSAPEVTIVSPRSKTYATAAIDLVVDVDQQATCSYSHNDGQYVPFSGATTLLIYNVTNKIMVECITSDGAVGSASVEFSQWDVSDSAPGLMSYLTFDSVDEQNGYRIARDSAQYKRELPKYGSRSAWFSQEQIALDTEPYTIMFWIKANATGEYIFGGSTYYDPNYNGQHYMYITDEGTIDYFARNSYNMDIESFPINDNTWHHVAVSRNGGLFRLYIDGLLQSEVQSNLINDVDRSEFYPFTIMKHTINNNYEKTYSSADVRDFQVYTEQLSDEEINSVYMEGVEQYLVSQSNIILNDTIFRKDFTESEKEDILSEVISALQSQTYQDGTLLVLAAGIKEQELAGIGLSAQEISDNAYIINYDFENYVRLFERGSVPGSLEEMIGRYFDYVISIHTINIPITVSYAYCNDWYGYSQHGNFRMSWDQPIDVSATAYMMNHWWSGSYYNPNYIHDVYNDNYIFYNERHSSWESNYASNPVTFSEHFRAVTDEIYGYTKYSKGAVTALTLGDNRPTLSTQPGERYGSGSFVIKPISKDPYNDQVVDDALLFDDTYHVVFEGTFPFHEQEDAALSLWYYPYGYSGNDMFVYSASSGSGAIPFSREGSPGRFNIGTYEGKFIIYYTQDNDVIRTSITYNEFTPVYHNWNHVVLTREGQVYTLYLNGEKVKEVTADNTDYPYSQAWEIGNPHANLDGKMDEFYLFQRHLTESEVTELYNAGMEHRKPEISMEELQKYLPFNESFYFPEEIMGHMGRAWEVFGVPGKVNQAYEFLGKPDSVIEMYPIDEKLDEITVMFWMHAYALDSWEALFSIHDGNAHSNEVMLNCDSNVCAFRLDTDGTDPSSSFSNIFNPNKWYHVALTWKSDTGQYNAYVDGNLIHSDSFAEGRTLDIANLMLGNEQDSFFEGNQVDQMFKGYLDEFRIYNRVLSAGEIQAIYTDESQGIKTYNEDGLILYLPCDDGGTTVKDYSGTVPYLNMIRDYGPSKNHGSLENKVPFVEGILGEGRSFDGSHNLVIDQEAITGNNPRTAEAWFYPTADENNVAGWSAIARFGGDGSSSTTYTMCARDYDAGNRISAHYWSYYTSSGKRLSEIGINQWHHIAITHKPGEQKIYIDGVLSGQTSRTLYTRSGTITIGSRGDGDYAKGIIDELRYYNRALTEAEIQESRNQVLAGQRSTVAQDNLELYSSMDGKDFTQGIVGKAMGSDGYYKYISCGNDGSLDLTSAGTWSAWVYLNGHRDKKGEPDQYILSKTGGGSGERQYVMQLIGWDDSQWKKLRFVVRKSDDSAWVSARDSVDFPIHEWTQVTATYDKNAHPSLKLYKNGELVGSDDSYHGDIQTGGGKDFRIGYDGSSFNGLIDEVRVYDRALTEAEIQESRNKVLSGQHSDVANDNLIFFMPMEGYETVNLPDTGRHGKIYSDDGSKNGAVYSEEGLSQQCHNGSCYFFDGKGTGTIRMDNPWKIEDNWTVNLWMYVPSDRLTDRYIMNNYNVNEKNGGGIHLDDGEITLYKYQVEYHFDNVDVAKNKWVMVSLVKKGDSVHLYYDGVYKGTETVNLPASSGLLWIGDQNPHNREPWLGGLDDISIYNRSLTHREIMALYGKEYDEGAIPSPDNLILHVNMNETGYTVTDKSGKENHGVFVSIRDGIIEGPDLVDAYKDKGLRFDGDDDFVTIVNRLDRYERTKNSFSYGAWFKTNEEHEIDPLGESYNYGTSGQHYLFDSAYYSLGSYEQSGLSCGTNGLSVYEHTAYHFPCIDTYESEIGDGWNHVMVVYDDKLPIVYLNGERVSTGYVSDYGKSVLPPMRLGGLNNNNPNSFKGTVDEVRIYDRKLSAEEVKAIYNIGRNYK